MNNLKNIEYLKLKAQLQELRNNKKSLADFDNPQQWVEYGQETAKKKAEIFAKMEKVFS